MGRFNNRYKRDMKQTAVEWLANSIINLEERLRLKEINLNDFIEEKDLLVEQAKAMEKEQIIEAHSDGRKRQVDNSEQYYNEQYGK
jgi:hypothetical protein